MPSEETLLRNFYRAVAVTAYVAGYTAVAGPAGTAAAMASLASPLGVASIELAADQATKNTLKEPTPKKKKEKTKRAPSAYNIAYAKAFKKEAPRFKKKDGSWKKNGFKNAGAAARRKIKK